MKIGCLQINATVGDLSGNAAKVLKGYTRAVQAGADLVVAPELILPGYPPRDLLLQEDFLPEHDRILATVTREIGPVPFIVGVLRINRERPGKPLFNAALVLREGREDAVILKQLLPTYDVFDEDRYFEPGSGSAPVEVNGWRIGITICEDIWNDEDFWPDRRYRRDPVKELAEHGIDLLLNLSASPWHLGKDRTREAMLREIALRESVPVVQVNLVGGNDELVFDGQTLVLNRRGEVVARGHAFAEDFLVVEPDMDPPLPLVTLPPDEEQLFHALALGLRDYAHKCGFESVALGLSGGIDSALTAAIAVEALGNDRVLGVLMPGPYSSEGSLTDAEQLAQTLEIAHVTIPIGSAFETLRGQLLQVFGGTSQGVTEENIQSRLRGLTLMAISNQEGRLILTTGNKSELATGYCTLYGDMCGGLAVISDLPKMKVYQICRWLNRRQEIIPWATIEKPPSAELRPNQTDQDSLPPYDVLDRIVEAYVVERKGIASIVAEGFAAELVREIVRKIDLNEYKRRQAAPGLKVTSRAFGVGRRMPVAQRFRHP
ncbi:MAG: NAD+ synthase [Candidatus Methylacidiphilales bacterium]